VQSVQDMQRLMFGSAIGKALKLTVLRRGQFIEVTVVPAALP